MEKLLDYSSLNNGYRSDVNLLIQKSHLFRSLLPSARTSGSGHSGEEGRWTESLVSHFIEANLPGSLEVSTGFIVDPRRNKRSYQVDILVHDSSEYPPIIRYGEAVVVHPKSVVAAISVKFKLTSANVEKELTELSFIGDMCNEKDKVGPFLSIFAFEIERNAEGIVSNALTNRIKRFYMSKSADGEGGKKITQNEIIDSVISLDGLLLHARKGDPAAQSPKKNVEIVDIDIKGCEEELLIEIIEGILKRRFGKGVRTWPDRKNNGADWESRIIVPVLSTYGRPPVH